MLLGPQHMAPPKPGSLAQDQHSTRDWPAKSGGARISSTEDSPQSESNHTLTSPNSPAPPGGDSAHQAPGTPKLEDMLSPWEHPSPALEGGTLTSWGPSWPAAPSSWLPEGLRRLGGLGGSGGGFGACGVGLEEGLASSAASLCHRDTGSSGPTGQASALLVNLGRKYHTHVLSRPLSWRRCFLQTPPHTAKHHPCLFLKGRRRKMGAIGRALEESP